MTFADGLSVLIVAPVGQDGRLVQAALQNAQMQAVAVDTIQQALALAAQQHIGALLMTEEVLTPLYIGQLSEMLQAQEPWSDLPVLILTVGGSATSISRKREEDRLALGSVTLLERPIRMATLISSVRSALRSRSRQYEVRDTLLQRDLAQDALRDSENRLRLAIDTAHLGAWQLKVDCGLLDASPTCRMHFDLPPEQELHFDDLLARIHPDDRQAAAHAVTQAIAAHGSYSAEYRVVWQDGTTHWISASGRVLDGDGSSDAPQPDAQHTLRFVGVTLDITSRVRTEEALRQADKLALVGRLASSIAHEINNPLEAVTNLLYLLAIGELTSEQKSYVLTAQSELARVSEIVAQTLSFNRQADRSSVVLPRIADSVLSLYRGRLTTSGVLVDRRYTFQQPVSCYPGEIRQVLTNLIGNAFDATRKGGRILLREREARHPLTGIRGVRLTIADTGTGIPQASRRRIFEAFHSTKGNNGTGLGLWISKGIVQKHGGTLRFSTSTQEGRSGTVFSIFLPM